MNNKLVTYLLKNGFELVVIGIRPSWDVSFFVTFNLMGWHKNVCGIKEKMEKNGLCTCLRSKTNKD